MARAAHAQATPPAAASVPEPIHHAPDATDSTRNWSLHFQQTLIDQWHNNLLPYAGAYSLADRESAKISYTSTVFIGRRLWHGARIFLNPEVAGGSGLSGARGIAGFVNGETFRIGDPAPQLYLARLYLRQVFDLGGPVENVEDDLNQLAGLHPTRYLAVNVGKFGIADYFDQNSYSHDPRTQFFNWSLMSAGNWDYPATGVAILWVEWLNTLRRAGSCAWAALPCPPPPMVPRSTSTTPVPMPRRWS